MQELGKISKPSVERFNNKKRLIYVPIFFIPPQLTEIKENNPFNEYWTEIADNINNHFTIDFIETIDKLKELLEQGVDMYLPQAKKFIDKIKSYTLIDISPNVKIYNCKESDNIQIEYGKQQYNKRY